MAFNSIGYPSFGSVFGGYAGGYNQTPEGIIIPPNTNPLGVNSAWIPGSNLPNVDPNMYPGTVHFGPSSAYLGSSIYPLGF